MFICLFVLLINKIQIMTADNCTYLNSLRIKMASKRRLTHDDRIKITILREEGYSMEAIAARVRCSHSAVSKTLSRFKETCSVDGRPCSGSSGSSGTFG